MCAAIHSHRQPTNPPRASVQDFLAELNALCDAWGRIQDQMSQSSGLLPRHRRLLALLEEAGPQTVPQLARKWGCSRQNLQPLVNRMARAGSIAIGENPAHSRSALVEITPEGMVRLGRTGQAEHRMTVELSKAFPEAEVAAAARWLLRIRDWLQPRAIGPPFSRHQARAATATRPRSDSLGQSIASPEPLPEPVHESSLPVNLL